jgi:hypothetical protein
MATAEEIKAFRAQENLEGVEIPSWMKAPINHAGLGDLEWLADFQGGTGPNVLVEDQETFTRPEFFANVIGPSKDASVEDKIALYLEIRDPKGDYAEGFRYSDGGEGYRWMDKYENFPTMEDSLFGKDRGLVDYDDDREDDESSTQLWEKSDRAMKGQDIESGVSYMHPAALDSNIGNQQTLWQHESLHGVFNEIENKATLDPWFKSLMESKEIKAESGVRYGFEEMVARLVDAKRNGDVEGLEAIINLPKNARNLFEDYRSGKKDGEEVRNALKTTLSYFMMEEMVTQASHNEYMGKDYLDDISDLSSLFSKSLDDAPLDQLFDMTLDVLKAQDVNSWISDDAAFQPGDPNAENPHRGLIDFWNDSVNKFANGIRGILPEEPFTIEIRK